MSDCLPQSATIIEKGKTIWEYKEAIVKKYESNNFHVTKKIR